MSEIIETDGAKIYSRIIGDLMDYCNEALYPGDERRIFGESLVQVFVGLFSLFDDRAKQRVLRYARGEVLDEIGENLRISRLSPAPASAVFRFFLSAAHSQNIAIPEGTRITADGSVYFATTAPAVIHAGSTFVDVQAECLEGGAAHNGYAVNTINTIVDLIPFVAGVYNYTATAGGDDGEPYTEDGDNRYRERIRLSPASLSPGTESGYIYYAKSADPDIADVRIVCPEDEPNAVNIYALMSDGALPEADTLQKILDSIEAGNVRIMTDHVQAFAPTVVGFSINVQYSSTESNKAAVIQAVEGEGGAIHKYIAWQTSKMGRGIVPDKLREYLYAAGASTVEITSPAMTAVAKNQVAQLFGVVATHKVVEIDT